MYDKMTNGGNGIATGEKALLVTKKCAFVNQEL